MQNKRGISAIVATVLIILITVASVTIVWTAIIPMIKTNLEVGTICLDADVLIDDSSGYTCYDADKNIVAVRVKKGSSDLNISEIQFVLSSGGISKEIVAPFGLGSNEKKMFYVPLSINAEEVSVAPVISVGNSRKTCDVTDTVKLKDCNLDSLSLGSCLDWLNQGGREDGVYWIDVDGSGENAPFEVNCDMTRDGGGWTQILKTWYRAPVSSRPFLQSGAIGEVSDGLTHLGNGYKLSDDVIREIVGPNQKFSILADQSGYNTAYSTGNYEYVILRDYTGYWRFDGPVSASTTTTTFQSYRISDDALAWTGNLQCGYNAGTGVAGINCVTVLSNNPQGGAGCDINMGTRSNTNWHHFFMSQYNQNTYLYICNGPQHSSTNRFSHRFWVRED